MNTHTAQHANTKALQEAAFRPCAVLPSYNHHKHLPGIISALLAQGLVCVLVDDASQEETQRALQALAADDERIILLRHEANKGKGGAVKTGLAYAHQAGFTHALQIDADGQHKLEDVPKLLSEAKRFPESVILGRPVFDDSIPKGRLYPRYITHVWVWIETLSLEIQDSMCGFRVYPLTQTMTLLNKTHTGDRMDFDIEVLVRLFWRNVPFVAVPTAVRYHRDEPSHFRLLEDNILISWLHTKLCIGMVCRFPYLLLRKRRKPEDDKAHWANIKERGSIWGIRFMIGLYKRMGGPVARLFLYPVIAYFFLTGKAAREASQRYLKKLYETDTGKEALVQAPTTGSSFHHMMEFGRAALDKLSAWMGQIKRDDVEWPNRELLLDHLRRGEGAILMGAHLGNIEVLRAVGEDNPELKMNVLVFTQHAEQFNRMMQELNPQSQVELIPVEEISIETGMMLRQKVREGEFVAILADRISPGTESRAQMVPFLGADAAFPEGPMVLASLLKCPVYLLFCLRSKGSHYTIHLEPFAARIDLPRKRRQEALREYLTHYAARLEAYCQKAPYQWFNFYDFWRPLVSGQVQPDDPKASKDTTATKQQGEEHASLSSSQ